MVEQNVADFSTPYQFNGLELEGETGLYNYGASYYDPRMSIWLGVDRLEDQKPGWSLYNFIMNNPINMIDPAGRKPEWTPNGDGMDSSKRR
ncbi:MAG: RHS repeat-associated protein [Saprospiraceae bacterium]|jgi:RHS repeat-associated protein